MQYPNPHANHYESQISNRKMENPMRLFAEERTLGTRRSSTRCMTVFLIAQPRIFESNLVSHLETKQTGFLR
jgi:hypothetical protein